ncbi:ABC transporter ATP-binding protein [Paenibacillus sp. P32E]|uniref:ABC transporter ATP-binding protein n=1 Tax=Paenibacillus sp. P32E TaxID=1349434 RepID=UPI001C49FC38|nr:ABC transporter ATP-binding protein [Paenibacillus sp. P32E]
MKIKNMNPFPELKKDSQVVVYFWKLVNSYSKTYIPLMLLVALCSAFFPFINIIAPKYIIDELMGLARETQLLLWIGILAVGNAIFGLLQSYLDQKMEQANLQVMDGLELHVGKHIMNLDFESLENAKVLDLKEQALSPIQQQDVISKMMTSMRMLLQTSLSLIALTALISTLNIGIILLILGMILLNTYIFKKSQQTQFRFYKILAPLNRKFGYYSRLATDFSMAKDIRLYGMAPFLLKKVDAYHKDTIRGFGELYGQVGRYKGLTSINLQLQMVVIYGYMIVKVMSGRIQIGDFIMYIAAANSFSTQVSVVFNAYVELRQMCRYLEVFREFESLPATMRSGERMIGKLTEAEIEFRGVYFKYAGSEVYSLKNVSLTIKSGENLAVVGQNGAGKSTFIKLLCRLYEPEQGEILLNGYPIQQYQYEDYMKTLGVVFQDYKLFSFSIKDNLSLKFTLDAEEEMLSMMKQVGLEEKIGGLEKGLDTQVFKTFDSEGTDFSGGEGQKMAMARALLKKSPILILDEPTAALDPYAEYEIYSNFNRMTEKHTVIYISHRLSSCKFCDKVAVFKEGELVEYGHHDQLVKNGKEYSSMWEAQAQYYD